MGKTLKTSGKQNSNNRPKTKLRVSVGQPWELEARAPLRPHEQLFGLMIATTLVFAMILLTVITIIEPSVRPGAWHVGETLMTSIVGGIFGYYGGRVAQK